MAKRRTSVNLNNSAKKKGGVFYPRNDGGDAPDPNKIADEKKEKNKKKG